VTLRKQISHLPLLPPAQTANQPQHSGYLSERYQFPSQPAGVIWA